MGFLHSNIEVSAMLKSISQKLKLKVIKLVHKVKFF